MSFLKKLKKIGMKVYEKKYLIPLIMLILIVISGTNVSAASNTIYEERTPYLSWNSSDLSLGGLSISSAMYYYQYLNIPVHVATYCNNMPGNIDGVCPSSFNSGVNMNGFYNGTAWEQYTGSIRWVDERFSTANNSKYTYATYNSGSNKMNYGYFNSRNDANEYDQTHKQNIYYVDDTHSNYYYRDYIRSYINIDNVSTTSTSSTPGFTSGNTIMYKMSYMLGPSDGSYGDGTWSFTSPEYEGDEGYSAILENAYNTVNNNANLWGTNRTNYFDYDYNNKAWYLQNNHFSAMYDSLENYPGCRTSEQCDSSPFQGANPMMTFLNLYGHTYYDKNYNKTYYKRTTIGEGGLSSGTNTVVWNENSDVYGKIILRDNSDNTVANLSTSTIIVAQPYNYIYKDYSLPYTSDGVYYEYTTFYSTVWFLDIYFFGYLDDTYDFSRILFEFNFSRTLLSMYGNKKQLDLISPNTGVIVLGNEYLDDIIFDDIADIISDIPIIGSLLSVILNSLTFIFNIINTTIIYFGLLPVWVRGGLFIIFISIVARIFHLLIRGG